MFEEVVAAQDAQAGDRLAYDDGRERVSYRRMAEDIAVAARWLEQQDVRAGARVLVQVGSVYRHWVLFFALEAVGAVSMAVTALSDLTASDLAFLKPDRVLTDRALPMGAQGFVLGSDWLSRVHQATPSPPLARPRTGEDAVTVVVSSGTTGVAKKVLLDRSTLDRRVRERSNGLIEKSSRVLVVLPTFSIGALLSGLAVFSVGATLCAQAWEEAPAALLARLRPSTIAGTPTHLARLVNGLPTDYRAPEPISVSVGGGALSEEVARATRVRLGGELRVSYASTEMGFVARGAFTRTGDVGAVLPGVEVSIRDADGKPLGLNETGEVWVRGPHVVGGYLEGSERDGLSFRDGWHHPGDVGALGDDGRLTILGRTDDLMNLSGRKILPDALESRIRALAPEGLVDVAVFAAQGAASGERTLHIACVAQTGFAARALVPAVPGGVPFAVLRVAAIPRNAMGKVERQRLRALIEERPAASA